MQGDKYSAKVMEVYPPKSLTSAIASRPRLKRERSDSTSSDISSLSSTPDENQSTVHIIGGDLSISLHESLVRDDPAKYFYKVQIIEEEKPTTDAVMKNGLSAKVERRESGRVKEMNGRDSDAKAKWGGSLMEVQCHAMSCV